MARLWRRRGALAIVLAAVCAAAVAGSVALAAEVPSAAPDPECGDDFSQLVLLGSGELQGLVVCSDEGGTGTLIRNETAAVWAVEGHDPVPVHLLQLDDRARSFTEALGGLSNSVPSGAEAVVAQPADRVRLRIDARLTIAQLAHDQMLATLARRIGPEAAALHPEPAVSRRALLACLAASLQHIESPGHAMASGRPGEVIAQAARAADAPQPSLCGLLWLEAKFTANLPSGYQTSFTADVVGWDSNEEFLARSSAAADAYRRLHREDAG